MKTFQPTPYAAVAKYYRAYFADHKTNITPLWQMESFRATVGESMSLRRAKALNHVLDNSFLIHCPGDLLVGCGNLGHLGTADAVPADKLAEADQTMLEIGRRTFAVFADHHAPDYATLLRDGLPGLRERIETSLVQANPRQREFLDAMSIALTGAHNYFLRWGEELDRLSKVRAEQAPLLRSQADRMRRLATERPETLHDALQLVLSFHHMFQLDRRGAMAFGRMDQYLYPFYQADLAAGRLDDPQALALFCHLFAKITVDGDVQNIALAGVRPSDGEDATNELSYMILEACRLIGQPGGNCSARIDFEKTPRAFVKKCAEVIRTGIGYPAVMNDRLTIQSLLDRGYALEDARNHCFVGCIEVFIPGKQAPWSDGRHNAMKQMQPAVNWLAEHEQALPPDQQFEAFYRKFFELVTVMTDEQLRRDTEQQRRFQERADDFTSPLMSLLVADCIERGRDLCDGGAVYPSNKGYGIVGIASIADSLAAVKKLVCEERRFTASQLATLLATDFEGHEAERQELLSAAPKFGNADDEVDALAARFVGDLADVFARHRNAMSGEYWMLLASNVQNIACGKEVGASPDGRHAHEPLSDASSPYFGRDHHGPTAVIRSLARLPYRLCPGGSVVNIKLDPHGLEGDRGLEALAALIVTCFRLGGAELQFNTTDRETLIDAMKRPELYENLVVRVSGFSYNYTWLDPSVQKDILARTEHAV